MDYSYVKENIYENEHIKLFLYLVVLGVFPFLVPGPQVVTGTLVNALLIFSAFHFKGIKLLPVIIAPSISVFLTGYIFGGFSYYLLYMLPLIWIGNFILIMGIKELYINKKINYLHSITLTAGVKTLILFSGAFILFQGEFIPQVILNSMGIIQFITAISGGILAYFLIKI